MVTLSGLIILGLVALIIHRNKLRDFFQALKKIETIINLLLGCLTGTFALFLKSEHPNYSLSNYIELINLHLQEFLVFHVLCIVLILRAAEKSYNKGQDTLYPILWSIIGLAFTQLVVLTVDLMSHNYGEEAIVLLILLFMPPVDIYFWVVIYFQFLAVLFGLSVCIALTHLFIRYYRLFREMPEHSAHRMSPEITKIAVILLIPITALIFWTTSHVIESITPESVKISRLVEKRRSDSLAILWVEEYHRKIAEENRRFEENRYKKHLVYVVARFNKKDSLSRRFIVLNTSTANIDSGSAIVFAHAWAEKSSYRTRKADTAEIVLRPIPSGRRDTLIVPQREREHIFYTIDSVVLVGIVFR